MTTDRLRPLERSLPIALLRAREAAMARFRPILARHGITDQQWRVLRALDAAPAASVGELAERACLLGPSVSRMLRTMEAQGWIARSPDRADARRSAITLAPAGRELVGAIGPASEAASQDIETSLGTAELDALLRALDDLTHTLEGRQGEAA